MNNEDSEKLESKRDPDDEWVEFGIVEVEEAMRRKTDPSSFS